LPGNVAFVKKANVNIPCDPLMGVEIIGSAERHDEPAVSLDLIGTVAEIDDPRYSVPDFAEDSDDLSITALIKELCIEVADALAQK
jgi:hypothetical protein